MKPTKTLRRTAYHEAGHAVASYVLHCGNKNATIVPDDGAGTRGSHKLRALIGREDIEARRRWRELRKAAATPRL